MLLRSLLSVIALFFLYCLFFFFTIVESCDDRLIGLNEEQISKYVKLQESEDSGQAKREL